MSWYYNGELFDSQDIGEHLGFVYLITDLSNDKKYVGKKHFVSKRKLPPLKGKKRKRTKIFESDWKSYYGSSEEVKSLVEEKGVDNFKREILHLCDTKGEMTYLELVEQIKRNVLFSDEYYNEYVGCRIHSSHVKIIKEKGLDKTLI